MAVRGYAGPWQAEVAHLLHGNKEPKERDQLMNDFRDGKTKVLISTNVLARGIDILQVTTTAAAAATHPSSMTVFAA